MKVLVTGRLPVAITSLLGNEHEVSENEFDKPMTRDEILDRVRDKDGLLCMITDRVDGELMDRAPHLKMIANCGVGFDNIDVPAATARGIWVSNTPGVLTEATADLTLALMLALARRVVEGDAMLRSGQWKHWAPFVFLGSEVHGRTLGIIGLGKIGRAVAKRAMGFDMPILYHNRSRINETDEQACKARYVDLDTLLSQSDFVSLHVSLNDQSRHLVGSDELSRMKPSSYLINVSRGPVVDENALVSALRSKQIAGAGLDVYENEPQLAPGLSDLHNVVLLPHIGSATTQTRTRMATLAVENLLAGLRGEAPPNCLNVHARGCVTR